MDSSSPESLRKPCICSLCVFLKTNLKSFFFPFAGSLLLLGFFSSFGEQGLLSSCSMGASHCGVFSCCRAQALGSLGCSNCDSWAPENRLNNCIYRLSCPLARGIFLDWDRTCAFCVGRRILYHHTCIAGLKCNIQKTEIMASGPIISWQMVGKKWKQ